MSCDYSRGKKFAKSIKENTSLQRTICDWCSVRIKFYIRYKNLEVDLSQMVSKATAYTFVKKHMCLLPA